MLESWTAPTCWPETVVGSSVAIKYLCSRIYMKKCVNVRQTLRTRNTFSLSHALNLSLSHSITLDMLNNFCFNVYAQSHSLIQSLLTCWTTFVFMSIHKSHSLSFTLPISHNNSHTLSLFQSLIHSLSTCGTTFVFMLRVFLTRFITVLNRTG